MAGSRNIASDYLDFPRFFPTNTQGFHVEATEKAVTAALANEDCVYHRRPTAGPLRAVSHRVLSAGTGRI
jgi:hypothetical protein